MNACFLFVLDTFDWKVIENDQLIIFILIGIPYTISESEFVKTKSNLFPK